MKIRRIHSYQINQNVKTGHVSWKEINRISLILIAHSSCFEIWHRGSEAISAADKSMKFLARCRLLYQFWRLINRRSPATSWSSSTHSRSSSASAESTHVSTFTSLETASTESGWILAVRIYSLGTREYGAEEEIEQSPNEYEVSWYSLHNR